MGGPDRRLPAAAGFPGTRSKHRDATLPASLRTGQRIRALAFVAVRLTRVCSHAVSRCVTVPENASSWQAPFTDNQMALIAIRHCDALDGQ